MEGGHLLFHRAQHDTSAATAALGDGAGPESPGIVRDKKESCWVGLVRFYPSGCMVGK